MPNDFPANEARAVPQEKIILRYTHALATKRAKWAKDLASGRVSNADGFIVAINDRSIPWGHIGAELPYIVKGLYGFGNLAVSIDRDTFEMIESRHEHRAMIAKVNGEEISSQAFVTRECPEVSAVLYAFDNAANYSEHLGQSFMILHNCEPNVRLPLGELRFGREYWVEGDDLRIKVWSEPTAA